MRLKRLRAGLVSIEVLTRVHLFFTWFWFFTLIPSWFLWRNSLFWVILLSWWALVATHWGAWQAARAELLSKQQVVPKLAEVAVVLPEVHAAIITNGVTNGKIDGE